MGLFKHSSEKRGDSGALTEHVDYFNTSGYEIHSRKIADIVAGLSRRSSPPGWVKCKGLAVGGLEYIAFNRDSRYLLVISVSGRGVFDIETQECVSRDNTPDDDWLNEQQLQCKGFGPIDDEILSITGIGGGGLPLGTVRGESLNLTAPRYPAYDVVYQPNYQNCFIEKNNKDCAVIYSGYVKFCGFSWDGNTMVVVDEDINIWRREGA